MKFLIVIVVGQEKRQINTTWISAYTVSDLTPCSSVFIVNFRRVIAAWVHDFPSFTLFELDKNAPINYSSYFFEESYRVFHWIFHWKVQLWQLQSNNLKCLKLWPTFCIISFVNFLINVDSIHSVNLLTYLPLYRLRP